MLFLSLLRLPAGYASAQPSLRTNYVFGGPLHSGPCPWTILLLVYALRLGQPLESVKQLVIVDPSCILSYLPSNSRSIYDPDCY